ncbi:PH domain-containing protein [Streptomyces sp. NPDC048717]|uniref:PH domain-containing protein n=1 Tax=Streptomyces sp. NPDC048717 TaxID=3154928 RepID=UPI00342CB2BB
MSVPDGPGAPDIPGSALPDGPGPGTPASGSAGWRRLSARSPLAGTTQLGMAAGAALPAYAGLASGDGPSKFALALLLGGVLLIVVGGAADVVRVRRTRYRVGPERVDLHTGLLTVRERSLTRDRIRSVDLTAGPVERLLGLVKVRIGTGEQTAGESTLELDLVTRAEGEQLRRALLGRPEGPAAATVHDGVLATLEPGWIGYAPVSFVTPLLGIAATGALLQAGDWVGVGEEETVGFLQDRFAGVSPYWAALGAALLVTAVGVIGALGRWIEMWARYRLEREPGGTLRVRRGLLTSRSVSLEERRLRGVELVEPLGIRLLRGARLDAVATGLAQDDDDQHGDLKNLLPPVPRAIADRVAAQVLRVPEAPTGIPLAAHPRAARTRRVRRALAAALAPAAVLAVLGAWLTPVLYYAAAGTALVLTPLALLLARDAYRGLGHGIGGAYLVTRSGSVRRSTVALQRSGVIGWTIRQTWFQRRAGVLTLRATTAAGEGAYAVRDAGESQGLAFAAEAVPDLLTPFLEPVSGKGPCPAPSGEPGKEPGNAKARLTEG